MSRMPRIAMAAAGLLIVARLGLMTADAATSPEEASAAETPEVVTAPEAPPAPASPAEAARALLSPDTPDAPPPEALPEMLAMIATESQALEQKRVALATREADLALVEEGLRRQRTELIALKNELSEILEAADLGDDNDLAKLVKMYTAMKPKEAAAIMGDLDLEVATMVIAAMRERDAGPILANMPAARAQTVSRIIYERSKLPGDQRPVVLPAGG